MCPRGRGAESTPMSTQAGRSLAPALVAPHVDDTVPRAWACLEKITTQNSTNHARTLKTNSFVLTSQP